VSSGHAVWLTAPTPAHADTALPHAVHVVHFTSSLLYERSDEPLAFAAAIGRAAAPQRFAEVASRGRPPRRMNTAQPQHEQYTRSHSDSAPQQQTPTRATDAVAASHRTPPVRCRTRVDPKLDHVNATCESAAGRRDIARDCCGCMCRTCRRLRLSSTSDYFKSGRAVASDAVQQP
jgi:hypothetical protein